MAVQPVHDFETLLREVASDSLTVVDCYAEWCAPCRAIAPLVNQLAVSNPRVRFLKVDVDTVDVCSTFGVTAMPTFLFFRSGKVIDRLEGANGPQLTAFVGRYATAQASFEDSLVALAALPPGSADDSFCTALISALEETTPFGSSLLPYMSQDGFPPNVLDRLLHHLEQSGNAESAGALVNNILNYVSSAAKERDWSTADTDVHTILTNIARSPKALDLTASSLRFDPPFLSQGIDVRDRTVLGAIAGIGLFGSATTHHEQITKMMEMFPQDASGRHYKEIERTASESRVAAGMLWAVTTFRGVLTEFLRQPTRNKTLAWVANTLRLNESFRKSMRDEHGLLQKSALAAFSQALVTFALPVVDQRSDWKTDVPAFYLHDPRSIARYADDEERVAGGDAAVNVPPVPEVEYKPKAHLFFLALRAVSIVQTKLLDEQKELYQRLSHPAVPDREKTIISGIHGLTVSLLTSYEDAHRTISFADSVSRWLLHVIGAQPDGSIASPISPWWSNLPICIIDDVFSTLRLITGLENRRQPLEVGFHEIQNIVSLMLLLMGNKAIFPKPHMHTVFPQFFMLLLDPRHPLNRGFVNHRWFVSHAMRACVECYIVIQPCESERMICRHYLSIAMAELLKDFHATASVQSKYNQPEDSTLEQLCTLLTGEANSALDSLFETLGKMHQLEAENARMPPLTAEYSGLGGRLRNDVIISKTAVELFGSLVDRFAKGMARHMVIVQISSALIRFINVMAGPKASELKITNAETYGFNPREFLGLIVRCFVKFSHSDPFRRSCIENQACMDPFYAACAFVIDRKLVDSDLCQQLDTMVGKIKACEAEKRDDDIAFDEPPEEFVCTIFADLLTDPVALPMDGEVPTYVNRDTIRHSLLTNGINPFTREPLTFAELEEHNSKPEVQEQTRALKLRIDQWKAEQREKRTRPS